MTKQEIKKTIKSLKYNKPSDDALNRGRKAIALSTSTTGRLTGSFNNIMEEEIPNTKESYSSF